MVTTTELPNVTVGFADVHLLHWHKADTAELKSNDVLATLTLKQSRQGTIGQVAVAVLNLKAMVGNGRQVATIRDFPENLSEPREENGLRVIANKDGTVKVIYRDMTPRRLAAFREMLRIFATVHDWHIKDPGE
jgi:hypothetical protein